jgi:hypothetical protein
LDYAAYVTKRARTDGTEMWTISAGTQMGEAVRLTSVATDADENVIVAGVYSAATAAVFGGVTLPPADNAMFVAKIDPAGNTSWVRVVSPQTDFSFGQTLISHVAVGSDGRIFVGSSFAGTVSFPNATFTAGEFTDNHAIVAALDADGTVLWGRAFQGPGNQTVGTLTVMPNGDVVAAGRMDRAGSFEDPQLVAPVGASYSEWIARLDPHGHLGWQRMLDIPGLTAGGPVIGEADDTIAISFTQGTVPGTAVLDPGGNTLWNSVATGHSIPGGGSVSSLALNADNKMIVAGNTDSGRIVDLGAGPIVTDGFLAVYDPDATSGVVAAELSICPETSVNCLVSALGASPTGDLVFAASILDATDIVDGVHVDSPQAAIMMIGGSP